MKRKHFFIAASAFVGLVTVNNASTAPVDLVARAGDQELSVERLAALMATSSVPLQKDVAAAVADFWITYQLLAIAGAHGDTLADSTSSNWWLRDTQAIDDAMWQPLFDARSRIFFDKVSRTIAMPDTSNLEKLYAESPYLAAQHILIGLPDDGSTATQKQQDSVRSIAEDVRRRVTNENFAAFVKQYSTDPGSKENGGTYAMFGPGEMVPEFEQAVRQAKPGEIAPGLVKSTFGYHIIRRHTLNEVRSQFLDHIARANVGSAAQKYVDSLRAAYQLTVDSTRLQTARAIGANPPSGRGDKTVLARSLAGDFTAARLAEWIDVIPPGMRVRETLTQAPDSLVVHLLGQIATQEIIQAQALKEGVELEPADLKQVRTDFTSMVTYAMTGLKVDPKSLSDSASTPAARERLAAARVEGTLDRLFESNGKNLVEVSPQLAAALRKRYPSRLSEASLDLAVTRATALRSALDSTRARGGAAAVKKD